MDFEARFKNRKFIVWTTGGSAFQSLEQLKALSPAVVRRADETDEKEAEEERSVREGEYV